MRTQDPELQAKYSDLLSRAIQLHREIDEFLAAEATRMHARLVEQREQVRAEGRKIQTQIEQTKAEMMRLRQAHASAKNKSEHLMSALHDARQARAALSRFAAAAEVKKADDAVAGAEEKLRKAQEAEAGPAQTYNYAVNVTMRELSEKLREIEAAERDLTLAIDGREGTDSLGFVHNAKL